MNLSATTPPRSSRPFAFVTAGLTLLLLTCVPVFAQEESPAGPPLLSAPVSRSVADLMAQEAIAPAPARPLRLPRFVYPDRSHLPQNPGAISTAPSYPYLPPAAGHVREETHPFIPQTLGTKFNGVTGPTETGAFPPDTMGVVGRTQFVVFVNGRIRSFNKTTGAADGVLNINPDTFFSSVTTPPGAGEVTSTTDPNVRYDRLTKRWFLTIIDVTLSTSPPFNITRPNRVLIAVSDAASNGVLTGSTVFTFYEFSGDSTNFADYPSLGVDANALFIGANMFKVASPGNFVTTNGYVIPKAPLLAGTTATVWKFANLMDLVTFAGPFSPRGVDNPDPSNTGTSAVGYFIGVDGASFGTLMMRRITNPGSTGSSPTISGNISIATPLPTAFPLTNGVPHLGNTGGVNGQLDNLDDRLFAAAMRNGRLWTAHNIGVTNSGVASGSPNRDGSRWYELQSLSGSPSVRQSGTLYDNSSPDDSNQRSYWIPSITVSGQGHAALGCSIAGVNEHANAFTTGRLAGDTLGTLEDGPGGSSLPGYTSSSTAYNPPGDPGAPRRWGDYSFTSVDPDDDMTMWTIQEWCNGTNTYGAEAVKLIAPPPATPAIAAPRYVPQNLSSKIITITGTSVSGSGFFDPGPDTGGPGFLDRLTASVTGGVTVNSATYVSPTSVMLDVSTVGATTGAKDVHICNPDGQCLTGNGILTVTGQSFFSVTPCRMVDTRGATGPYGAPALAAGANRTFVAAGQCGIPSDAVAVALNLTATEPTGQGDLRIFPAGGGLPLVSSLNWSAGQTRANNAVVGLGAAGDLTVHPDQVGGTVQLVIDVNGFFK